MAISEEQLTIFLKTRILKLAQKKQIETWLKKLGQI